MNKKVSDSLLRTQLLILLMNNSKMSSPHSHSFVKAFLDRIGLQGWVWQPTKPVDFSAVIIAVIPKASASKASSSTLARVRVFASPPSPPSSPSYRYLLPTLVAQGLQYSTVRQIQMTSYRIPCS
jgi:hypothetical protein